VFADEPSLVPWQMLLTFVPDPLPSATRREFLALMGGATAWPLAALIAMRCRRVDSAG
jgi:hypothetical protein